MWNCCNVCNFSGLHHYCSLHRMYCALVNSVVRVTQRVDYMLPYLKVVYDQSRRTRCFPWKAISTNHPPGGVLSLTLFEWYWCLSVDNSMLSAVKKTWPAFTCFVCLACRFGVDLRTAVSSQFCIHTTLCLISREGEISCQSPSFCRHPLEYPSWPFWAPSNICRFPKGHYKDRQWSTVSAKIYHDHDTMPVLYITNDNRVVS